MAFFMKIYLPRLPLAALFSAAQEKTLPFSRFLILYDTASTQIRRDPSGHNHQLQNT
jgi:hypothetical protein